MRPVLTISCAFLALASAGAVAAPDAPVNRLAQEKSPYLRQHADNPVDWYPWGPEAFARARAEDKLIFLSIGYSTCHWCHVMERESFANAEVAAVLNARFVCIKVDREERPEVDRVYLTFLQATTGQGGWPMTLWLTPDLKPVFGGTYFPPQSGHGQPGLKELAAHLAEKWRDDRQGLLAQADEIFAALVTETRSLPAPSSLPDLPALRRRALARAAEVFDARHGGFESAPKFPNAVILDFLLDEALTAPEEHRRQQAREMALTTLRALATGGIHDLLEGGFHRYTVDAAWRVPHFEKMLADQAQLVPVLLTAWQLSAEPLLRDAARDTLAYVQRRLTSPEGGFCTAEDADSPAAMADRHLVEGAFYVWTVQDFATAAGPEDAAWASFAFGVKPGGNVETADADALAGKNVLYRAHNDAECARQFGLTEAAVRARLDAIATRLCQARDARPRPARDDKILTSWNGLMISAFARAARVLGDPAYAAVAVRAATFLREHLVDPVNGRLAHSYRAGIRDTRGFAEDYAFLIQGLLDLYEADADATWLAWAVELQARQEQLFGDPHGGYFHSAAGDPEVPLRLKTGDDGAEPSPNAVAVRNLARLAALLHRDDWREKAAATVRAFVAAMDLDPFTSPVMLAASGWLEAPPRQILIQGEPDDPATVALTAEINMRPLARAVVLQVTRRNRPWLDEHVEFVRALPASHDAAPLAYLCENYVCRLPTSDPGEFARQLDTATPPRR